MSFGKNLFVFVSGAVVGAGALAGFAGWKMYKALKKNDVLYTAVRSSVDAGVKAASSEFSEHGAKAIVNMLFGWPKKRNKVSYEDYYSSLLPKYHNKVSYKDHYSKGSRTCDFDIDQVSFGSRKEAANVLDSLADILDQYGTVTVADFYDETGLKDPCDSDTRYGWKDIDDAYVVKVRSGWSISLPDPIKLE
nr:MAG TPA: hypothetical protein [Bacteriophage sp.]